MNLKLNIMTNAGLTTIKSNLESNISKIDTKYNRKRIFKRAWYLVRTKGLTLSSALKQVWSEWKRDVNKARLELQALQTKLKNLFTPEQFHETTQGIQLSHYNLMNNLTK